MNVERYYWAEDGMESEPEGEYVRWEDVESLLEKRRAKLEAAHRGMQELIIKNDRLGAEIDQLEQWLRFYSDDDVDVDYMLADYRNGSAS